MADAQTAPAPGTAATPAYSAPGTVPLGAATTAIVPPSLAPTVALPAPVNAAPSAALPPPATPPAAMSPAPGAAPAAVAPEPAHPNLDRFLQDMRAYREENYAYWKQNSAYQFDSERRVIDTELGHIEDVLNGKDLSPGAQGRFETAVQSLLHSQFEFEHLLGRPGYNPAGISAAELNDQGIYEDQVVGVFKQEVHALMSYRQEQNRQQAIAFQAQETQAKYDELHSTLAPGLLDAFGKRVELTTDGSKKTAWNVQIGQLNTYIAADKNGGYAFAIVPPNGGELFWQKLPPDQIIPVPKPGEATAPEPTPPDPLPANYYEMRALRGLMSDLHQSTVLPIEYLAHLKQLEATRTAREEQNSRWGDSQLATTTLLELMQPRAIGDEIYQLTWGTTELQFRRGPNSEGQIEWKYPDEDTWQGADKRPFAADTKNPEEASINARIALLHIAGQRTEGIAGGFERYAVAQAKSGHVAEALTTLDASGSTFLKDVLVAKPQTGGSYLVEYGGFQIECRKNTTGAWEWRQTNPASGQAWTDPQLRYSKGDYPSVPSTFTYFNRVLFYLDRINQAEGEIAAIQRQQPAQPMPAPAQPQEPRP